MRKLQSPFDKLPQRRFIAMSTFTGLPNAAHLRPASRALQLCKVSNPSNIFKHPLCCPCLGTTFPGAFRYHRSTFSVSCLRAESQQQLRQRKHTYGSSEYKVAVNSQQASPQTSLVRRHLLSSAALVGLLSSTPIAWAQEQLDAPEPVQAAKDLIAGEPMHKRAVCAQYKSLHLQSSRVHFRRHC